MRRRTPPVPEREALETALRMMREAKGLRLLQAALGPNASREEALRALRAQHQRTRQPSALLDEELGIIRGPRP
jgi:hypothetical protein